MRVTYENEGSLLNSDNTLVVSNDLFSAAQMLSSNDPAIRGILDLEARLAYDAANGGTNQAYLKRKIYEAKQAFYQSAAATQGEVNAAFWGSLSGGLKGVGSL